MKLDVTIDGKKYSKAIPLSWAEVKFREYLAYQTAKDDAEVISIFTGIPSDTLRKAKISNLGIVRSALEFLKTPVDYGLPKEILGYQIKDNLEVEEIQRYADLEALIKEFKEGDINNLSKYPTIVATYVVNPYNFKDAENLSTAFLDAPAMEVLAVGNFTWVNINVLNSITPLILQFRALPRNNWRQAMRSYIVRLAFSVSFYFLKRRLPRPVKNYLSGRLQNLSLT